MVGLKRFFNLRVLILVCFASQQIAFAAPASSTLLGQPLASPSTTKEALEVIQRAEFLPIGAYFAKGGTTAEVERFNSDLVNVGRAHKILGTAEHYEAFMAWYQKNQASIIMGRAGSGATDIDGFFMKTLIRYERETAKDPWAFFQWVQGVLVNHPILATVGVSAWSVAMIAAGSILTTIKGAVTAGPAAGMANSYLEPVVRPIREKAGLLGAKHWGSAGVALNAMLFQKTGSKKGAAEELQRLLEEIQKAEGEGFRALELNAEFGYDITAAAHLHNMEMLRSIWSETNLVWQNTNPATYRDGRDVFTNATSQRPQQDMVPIMLSRQGAEQAQQAIEAIIERIIDRKHLDPQTVENQVVKLLRLVQLKGSASETNSPEAKAELEHAKAALKELGATEFQVERLIESRLSQLVYARNTAHALAANWIRETQYPEYNINLPDSADHIQRILREGNVLTFFHQEFKAEVATILKEMNFMIEDAKGIAKAAAEAPNSPLEDVSEMPDVAAPERRSLRKVITDKATSTINRLRGRPMTCSAIFG